jgi:putative transposase
MIEIVRRTQRNVKRWRNGDMRKRWTARGMLEAERQFRRIMGYRHLAPLVIAIERHTLLSKTDKPDSEQAAQHHSSAAEQEEVALAPTP